MNKVYWDLHDEALWGEGDWPYDARWVEPLGVAGPQPVQVWGEPGGCLGFDMEFTPEATSLDVMREAARRCEAEGRAFRPVGIVVCKPQGKDWLFLHGAAKPGGPGGIRGLVILAVDVDRWWLYRNRDVYAVQQGGAQ